MKVERIRAPQYGTVAGLDPEELLDDSELNRLVLIEMYGPLLAIPAPARSSYLAPVIDEDGCRDFGAFGTVDFERLFPERFRKEAYQQEKLRDELADTMMRLNSLCARLERPEKYQLIQRLQTGSVALREIIDRDLHALARLYLRARRLRNRLNRKGI